MSDGLHLQRIQQHLPSLLCVKLTVLDRGLLENRAARYSNRRDENSSSSYLHRLAKMGFKTTSWTRTDATERPKRAGSFSFPIPSPKKPRLERAAEAKSPDVVWVSKANEVEQAGKVSVLPAIDLQTKGFLGGCHQTSCRTASTPRFLAGSYVSPTVRVFLLSEMMANCSKSMDSDLASAQQDVLLPSSADPPPFLPPQLPPTPGLLYEGEDRIEISSVAKAIPAQGPLPASPPTSVSINDTNGSTELTTLKRADDCPSPSGPYRPFKDMAPELLDKILGYVFAHNDEENALIRPFYRQGMLAGYIRTGNDLSASGHGKSDEVTENNLDLRAMSTCKQFMDAGSRLFYGNHAFKFSHPAPCKWWFKHIGSQNVANIRSLSIVIRSGYDAKTYEYNARSTFDLVFEEQWYQFCCWLRDRHNLHTLRIELFGWQLLQEFSNADEQTTDHWRGELLEELHTYRGLSKAYAIDRVGSVVSQRDCNDLSLLMMQRRDTVRPLPDRRNVALAELLQLMKDKRLMQEANAAREREELKHAKKQEKALKKLQRHGQTDLSSRD